MKRILLFCFVALTLLVNPAWAQERTVSGKVTSSEDGSGLPGVNVIIKGTQGGTTTDIDGNFKLSVPEGTVLQFSAIGFAAQEVAVGARSIVDVRMELDVKQLSEVVVTGYGSQLKREVSSSIGSVSGEAIKNLPIPSVDRMIQGRIAGVQITANNGIPGGLTQVRIRGIGSINGGNAPLYIIDGVQISPADNARRVASSNSLNGLNPNDIETIDVLKDAAAASVYGAQAANGVIIITTKKGKSGAAQYSVNYNTGVTQVLKKIDMTSSKEWIELRTEALANAYKPYDLVFGPGDGDEFARTTMENTYGPAASAANYDWQDAISRNGIMHSFDISASGGTDKTKYYASISYYDQNAQFVATQFKRGSVRLNTTSTLSSKLTFETSINASRQYQDSPFGNAFNTNNQIVTALGTLPMNSPYNLDGSYNMAFQYPGALGNASNPLFQSDVNILEGVTDQIIGSGALSWNILNNLIFKSSYSVDFQNITESAYFDARTPGGGGVGSVSSFDTRVFNWQTDQTLTYNETFNDDHSVGALLGFNYRSQELTGFNAAGINVVSPAFGQTLAGTTPNTIGTAYGAFKLAGVFGRVTYGYKGKYLFTGTLRRDGSSRFGSDTKFGLFPAISGAWIVSDEAFMSGLSSTVPTLKVRASFGQTGNQDIGDFGPRSLFGTSTALGYSGAAGIAFTQLGNELLAWERNETVNLGLDFGVLNNRVTGTVDYFWRTTKDLLLLNALPSTSGFGGLVQNVGSIQNRGLEILVSTKNIDKEFTWSTDFNITFIKNEVLALLADGEDLPNSGLWKGKPLGQQFTARYAGVNPADGRAMWLDTLGNIAYQTTPRDRVFVNTGSGSNLIPKYYGGITNTFTYKGIELSGFLQFNVGQLATSNQAANLSNDFRYEANQERRMLDRWTTPGQFTDYPRVFPGGVEPGSDASLFGGGGGHDRFLEDASYIRLKQLQIAYTLPSSITDRIKMSSVKFYAQGVNLWTKTQFTGLDPEFASGTSDIGVVPQGKSIIGGVQFGF